ncbi:MAG: metallophosphoesterase [Clostridiaceae bacterium]|nr:metallophosphoesterase [Clostridiaceae bacterium]
MSSHSSNIVNASLFKKKVNYIGKKLLENNNDYNMNNNFFSIVFISDTHSEQLTENKRKNSSLEQYCMLLKKVKVHPEVCCIIHGGDAIQGFTNNSKKSNLQLKQFIAATKLELYEQMEPTKLIPFVMNIGNHDYCYDGKRDHSSDNFNDLVGENSDLIMLKKNSLDIILLETGDTHNGFVNINSFKKEINSVEKKIKKEHKKVLFLLDMHIPPQLGELSKYSNHTLNSQLTNEFVRFLNKYQNRIIAISTHHIHNFRSEDSALPIYIHPQGNIPIYLTSNGGQKDSSKHSKIQYKCLKMNFEMNENTPILKDVAEIK